MRNSKPTIYDPKFLPNNIYSGVPSWLNLPVIEEDEDLNELDIAIVGVPWEGGCTIGGYSSCTEGPKSIRSVSIRYTGFLPDFNLDSFEYLKGGDFGDVPVQNGNYDFTFEEIRKKVAKVIDADVIPITFGGDHSISYPIISEMAKKHPKKVGILHFDAHLDNYEQFGDDPYSRCSPFYRLYTDENMDPTKIVHIGIRGPRNHKKEYENAEKFGATVIKSQDVKEKGWKEAIDEAIAIAFKDTEVVYVTICADALDAAFMPQGPQDMCGLTSYELAMMVHEAGLAGAKGFDFVEIYPETNSLQTASHVGCWMALYYLNGLAEYKKNRL
ncbi:agmatinase family protein [Peptoniphilus indolicus]|uniref:Agmatinase n=2 Tax=Peptoniphilus indolicus TaxID=33030 RepID=G4D120_9FIRM|nr:agmatinase family protein [Peptoniphilus indolicus]EGY80770.1 agmatinase [Peptoniphilus indolicus ATCC 29427]SUB74800.1 Guanidinobutyrase [Peptoniphilus indolicus]